MPNMPTAAELAEWERLAAESGTRKWAEDTRVAFRRLIAAYRAQGSEVERHEQYTIAVQRRIAEANREAEFEHGRVEHWAKTSAECRAARDAAVARAERAEAALREADALVSAAHDALYADPMDKDRVNQELWLLHDLLRPLARRESDIYARRVRGESNIDRSDDASFTADSAALDSAPRVGQ